MSEKEYIVSLNQDVDYAAFDAEMVATTGAGAIPNRSAPVANARPGSKRNTHYMLTDAEAETLRSDPRVLAVEIPPEQRDDIMLMPRAVQNADFTKTTSDSGDFVNWGLRRVNEAVNPYGTNTTVAGGYNYTLDGTGVDVVIQDSGIQADHPDFNDADGVSRVQQIDWYTESGLSGTMPPGHYTDYDGHGTHCAGIAAGKTYGWAKNARIYAVKVAGLQGSSDPNGGIGISDCFDVIKEWHNNKPVDPATGVKRPTIVNMSWGYGTYFYNVNGGEYRGTPWTSPTQSGQYRDTTKGMIGVFADITFGYRHVVRVPSVDVDVQEMIDAGIHVCIAAGNSYQKIDVPSGTDYDNYWTRTSAPTTPIYYHRGGSPFSSDAFIVGNIDSATNANTLEQKASSSENGPGVNMWAPGTNIMSTTSNTNKFTDGAYPPDTNYRICNISGTSMASPQVCGMMALYLQIEPSLTPAQLKTWAIDTAKSDQIYTTGLTDDYTDSRSIKGSANKFLFNPFNVPYQLRITG
jgi:subtilisin family serine protease